eukprot:g13052.t1
MHPHLVHNTTANWGSKTRITSRFETTWNLSALGVKRRDASEKANSIVPALRKRNFLPFMFEIDTWVEGGRPNGKEKEFRSPDASCLSWMLEKVLGKKSAGRGRPSATRSQCAESCLWRPGVAWAQSAHGWKHCPGTCREFCGEYMDEAQE